MPIKNILQMKAVTIGRSEDNDVVINDAHASRYHMQIIQHDDGHYTLADFGSTNGTYINGQKASGETFLTPSDIVRIGNTTIPWRNYFESDSEIIIQPDVIDESLDDNKMEERVNTATNMNDDSGDIGPGLIISIIISIIMIIGGLTGTLALKGTGSSTALVIVGAILLVVDIVKIVLSTKK